MMRIPSETADDKEIGKVKQTKRIFWIIACLAALAIVAAALLFQRGVFDTGKDSETVSPLDETEQSPRLRFFSKATNGAASETRQASRATDMEGGSGDETGRASGSAEASANDLDAAAREYDDNGQIGEPPEGWKPDYSHWDTKAWGNPPLEEVGIMKRVKGATALVYRPSEETRQRSEEIENERNAAIEKGLIIGEPREGYVKRGFGEGDDVAYVARSFVGRFDALLLEDILLNKGGMREEPTIAYTGSGSVGYMTENFEIFYYREKDGSLTRKVFLNFKNGKSETFKVSPPPDLEALGFEPIDIEHHKGRWKSHGGVNYFRDEYRKGE